MDTRLLDPSAPLKTAIFTHPGLDPEKQVNEDVAACLMTPLGLLCVVCDGMGGHANGKQAAETAVTTIVDAMRAHAPGGDPKAALEGAIVLANSRVYALSVGRKVHAGSTCVAVLVHDKGTELAHVGDSRAHLVHKGTVAVITRDHSKVRAMVDAGMLTPEEAKVHPEANQITRALGIAESVEVEMRPTPLPHTAGDVYVLCSDGLSDLVTPEEMLEHVMSADEAAAAEALVGVALSRGGHDNTTVAIVRVTEDAAVPRAGVTELGTPPPAPVSGPTTERPPAIDPKTGAAPLPRRTTQTTADGGRPSRVTLFAGLGLALAAIAILVALYVVIEKRKTRVLVPTPGGMPSQLVVPPPSTLLPAQ